MKHPAETTAGEVTELLLRWEELRGEGRLLSADELCRDRPELREEVARRIDALLAVYGVPNQLPATASASRPAPPAELPRVEGYEVLGLLGVGGMGAVYKARDLRLGRLVALKMVLAGKHARPSELVRFRLEAEAVAALGHAHIVQVHEVGEADDCPYLALEYVGGGTLAGRLQQGPLAPRPAAELVRVLAQAMDYAYRRGVIHRDLKPANVLLAFSREPAASASAALAAGSRLNEAVPKITDFGLAKRLGEAGGQTATGEVFGTPSYMAPEQAQGKTKDVGPATDVYAL